MLEMWENLFIYLFVYLFILRALHLAQLGLVHPPVGWLASWRACWKERRVARLLHSYWARALLAECEPRRSFVRSSIRHTRMPLMHY